MSDATDGTEKMLARSLVALFLACDSRVADDVSLKVNNHIATLTLERDEARRTSQYWKDEKLASEREIDTLTQQRDEARVVTDAMVERASTTYRKWAAPSLRSVLDASTIRAILTAALSEAA
jgi:hypothetical protein